MSVDVDVTGWSLPGVTDAPRDDLKMQMEVYEETILGDPGRSRMPSSSTCSSGSATGTEWSSGPRRSVSTTEPSADAWRTAGSRAVGERPACRS